MTTTMLNRLAQLDSASPAKSRAYIGMDSPAAAANRAATAGETFTSSLPATPGGGGTGNPDNGHDYRFSVGQLPVWAKKQIRGNEFGAGGNPANPDQPVKGRWAQRVGGQVTVKSHYEDDSVIPFPSGQPAPDSPGSSGPPGASRRPAGTGSAAKKAANDDKNNQSEHDADIDEYSDGLTMGEDGGESTEPEQHTEKTLFFGQSNETPR